MWVPRVRFEYLAVLHICCFEDVFSAFGLWKNEGQQGGQKGRPDRNFSMATFQGAPLNNWNSKGKSNEAFFFLQSTHECTTGSCKIRNESESFNLTFNFLFTDFFPIFFRLFSWFFSDYFSRFFSDFFPEFTSIFFLNFVYTIFLHSKHFFLNVKKIWNKRSLVFDY